MEKRNKLNSVIISPQAKANISHVLFYLEKNWNQKAVDEFLQKLHLFYYIISINSKVLDTITRAGIFVDMHLPNKILFTTETGGKQLR